MISTLIVGLTIWFNAAYPHAATSKCHGRFCMRIVGTNDYIDQRDGTVVHDETYDGELIPPPRDAR